jgi:glutathione S-transferase
MAKHKENDLVFHHAPWTRSAGVLWLIEELGVPYDLRVVPVHKPEGVDESYRAIQPHKKVPAIQHRGLTVTERAAISIYLADTFTRAKLAPALDDPMRGAYLTMLVYCDSVFDPCVAAQFHGLRQASNDYSFGTFDDMVNNIERILTERPYAAGDHFTAADTHLASSLGYTMHFMKTVPVRPAFEAYLARVADRPARLRAQQIDAALAERHLSPARAGDVVQTTAS